MKKNQFYAGAVSLGIAAALALLGLTKFKVSFSNTSLSTMTIYPAAFFALLGLLLMYYGLRPLWRN
jgi:hypothetical protein